MSIMRLASDLKDLARVRAFRLLLAVRLISQTADGLVQAGLATLFFFSPQNMTDAAGVASALVVMLLPFSIVGPFTGPFIDRWRRRNTLAWGNVLRALLIAITALLMNTVGIGLGVYLLVMVALGVNRFLLSALSAGLPQIISRDRLLVANSIVPTLGGAATALGAVVGIVLRFVLPAGASQNTGSLLVAVALYLAAALVVCRLAPGELGPSILAHTGIEGASPAESSATASSTAGYPPQPTAARGAQARDGVGTHGTRNETGEPRRASVAGTARELAEAARYLCARRTPALALGTMALHRFVYGMMLITMILSARNLLAASSDADTGLALFGGLMGAMVAGHGVAVIVTPLAHERIAPHEWIVCCLVGGSLGQVVVAATHELRPMMVGIFVFGIGVQGAKIAVDTIVQADTADEYRGRAFSIYDVLFNTAECVAAGVAVLVLPDVGWSRAVLVALLIFVWLLATAYARSPRHARDVGV